MPLWITYFQSLLRWNNQVQMTRLQNLILFHKSHLRVNVPYVSRGDVMQWVKCRSTNRSEMSSNPSNGEWFQWVPRSSNLTLIDLYALVPVTYLLKRLDIKLSQTWQIIDKGILMTIRWFYTTTWSFSLRLWRYLLLKWLHSIT